MNACRRHRRQIGSSSPTASLLVAILAAVAVAMLIGDGPGIIPGIGGGGGGPAVLLVDAALDDARFNAMLTPQFLECANDLRIRSDQVRCGEHS